MSWVEHACHRLPLALQRLPVPNYQYAPTLLYSSPCRVPQPHYENLPAATTPDRGVHFITFSCYHRIPLLGNPEIRDRFATSLAQARTRHHFQLLAWIALPEHVHPMLIPIADKDG